MARLETAERAAENGDFVVIDFLGTIDGEPFEGGEGRDQLVELGSGRLIPGFEEGLIGARAGEEKTVDVTFPDDYPAEHLAGKPAQFEVTVKEVKEQGAARSSTTTSPPTPPASTRSTSCARTSPTRMREADEQRVEAEFREAVLDAVVARRDGRRARRARRGARQGAVGAHAALALAPGDLQGGLPADLRARPRRRCSTRPSPTPSARCAARRCSPRSSRPRRSSPPTASCSTRCRRRAAREHDAREAASSASEGRPPRRPARGPRAAPGDRPGGGARDVRAGARSARRVRIRIAPLKLA